MSSNAPRQRRLSPQRLYQAEQHAARAYNLSVTDTDPASFDSYFPDPPPSLWQRGRRGAFSSASVHRGRSSTQRAAAHLDDVTAPFQQTEQVTTMVHDDLVTVREPEKHHGTESYAASYSICSRMAGSEVKSNHRKHSRERDTDENQRKNGKLIDDDRLSLGYETNTDLRAASATTVAKHDTVPEELEQTADYYGVIESVKTEDEVDCRDSEIDLEPSRPFTSRARTRSISIPVTLAIRTPSLSTVDDPLGNQCEDSLYASQPEETFVDTFTTSPSTPTYRQFTYFQQDTADPLISTLTIDTVENMSDQAEQAADHQSKLLNNMASESDQSMPASGKGSNFKRWSMVSGVEEKQGVLRTTSDGHLGGTIIEEETGEIISLNKPDDIAQKHYEETHKLAPVKRINAPEAKNGGTGADDPRARKPVSRVIKNWMTGSNRPPQDEQLKIFQVGDREPGRVNFEEMIKTRRHHGGTDTRYTMQKIIKRFWGADVAKHFGEAWVDKTDSHELYMRELEDFVLTLTVDRSKPENQEEALETSQTADVAAGDSQKKSKSGNSWWW